MPQLSLHSPVGDLTISEEDGRIVSLDWGWGMTQEKTPLLEKAKSQLEDYFDGKLKKFELPLHPVGTEFQRHVYTEMRRIVYGSTKTYGDLAFLTNSHARAVGQACGSNPIPILIPCHRVLGKGENLTGYSGGGGVETKSALLRLEGAIL